MPPSASRGLRRTSTLEGMSITVKAADAAQFLSLVPHLLGFTPTESLVLVPMARGRSLGAMRLDLPPESPPSSAPDVISSVASSALGMICRIGEAEALVAVVYTNDLISETGKLPGASLIAALGTRADACGIPLIDALTVAGDGWGSHVDPSVPDAGRSLDELRVREPHAGALCEAGAGPEPLGDQTSGAVLPRVGQQARRAVAQALRSLDAALETICGIPCVGGSADRIDPAALEAACELDDLPALFESALTWHPAAPPMHTAMLGWCLSRPSLRDIALVQWASDRRGGDAAMEAQLGWEKSGDYPADLASIMWGEGPRPDAARLETALALVREVGALMPKAQRPGPLAVCAWLSWALGRSSHADRYAAQALSIDHRHGLSEIVRSFVQAGHLPEWAFRTA
jgi:hypothetical protein